jgi:PIN domain nuclease of toxin-antitoxin system
MGGGKLIAPHPVLLDTCAAIWLMNGDPMSDGSRSAITEAQQLNLGVFVSPISAWEIGILVARNRVQLSLNPEIWFDALLALPGMRQAAMPPGILIGSSFLPDSPLRDPADRIIAATVRAYGYALITRDGALSAYAQAGHINVIPC